MADTLRNVLRVGWKPFVDDIIASADREWATDVPIFAWVKADGSRVSSLDLRLDAAIRSAFARHLPHVAVLSEETGLLSPMDPLDDALAIIDPIDGTDSLLKQQATWWMSVGILDQAEAVGGFIYQPRTGTGHDAAAPDAKACAELVVGMSPDQLLAEQAAPLRGHLTEAGAKLVSTPHAVEKVAAVLEGRCAAAIYLPSQKSPHWHSWDLAACVAIASANGLLLQTLDGRHVRIEPGHTRRSDAWICAGDQHSWDVVRRGLR